MRMILEKAWRNFLKGKTRSDEISVFRANLDENLSDLAADLVRGEYAHGPYRTFQVNDPKPRTIRVASVRDRVVHRFLYDALISEFDRKFIHDSYASRPGKGVHAARVRFGEFARSVSRGWRRPVFVLHGDIRSYFESVRHAELLVLLADRDIDGWLLRIIESVIRSYESTPGCGMPLGNLTSQLFANVYLHEFDRQVKHELRVKRYLRYCDDFFFVADDREFLNILQATCASWLQSQLGLRTRFLIRDMIREGADVLGAVITPSGTFLRSRTTSHALKCTDMRQAMSYMGLTQSVHGYWTTQRLLDAALES